MINLLIDGKEIEVQEGTTVLEAARQAGIHIPTLCDHKELTPYGGCRMCLVEIEGFRTLVPSCTLPAGNGMVVKTATPKVLDARKFVLTLIFSERNHFCMYCQVSGGDCELQNAAYGEGMTHWPLQPNWKKYDVDASHPNFILENNRCILCRRCIRACNELVGNFTLGMEERGANSVVVADLGVPLGESTCVSCGMCVQVCPTGALIDRQSAYKGRETQVEHNRTLCVGCSVGCTVDALTRDNHLVRIESDWEDPVSRGVLCQKGRFDALEEGLERILTPLVRKNGNLKAATWDEALEAVTQAVKPLAGQQAGGVAAAVSTRQPAEVLHQFKQLFADGIGSAMVTTFEDGVPTSGVSALARELKQPFEGSLEDLKESDCVLVVGADLHKNHQVAGFFIKRNRPTGTKLIVLDAEENGLEAVADVVIKPGKTGVPASVKSLLEALSGKASGEIGEAAALLKAAKKPVIVCGKNVTASPDTVKALHQLAEALPASLLSIKGKANSLAAAQYGLEREFEPGKHAVIYAAIGDERPSQRLLGKLAEKQFLVVQASYASPLTALADVVLPVTDWREQSGHFVNADGRLQQAMKCITPPDEVRENVEVLRDLAERLGVKTDEKWQAALNAVPAPVAIK